jgi:hypothetical protein
MLKPKTIGLRAKISAFAKVPKMSPDLATRGNFLTNVNNTEILHSEAAFFAVDSQL